MTNLRARPFFHHTCSLPFCSIAIFAYICNMKFLLPAFILLMTTPLLYAENRALSVDSIKGADMTFYRLYNESKTMDLKSSMNYLEIFLSGIDTSTASRHAASLYDELSKYYQDRFLFSKAIDRRISSLRIYKALGDRQMCAECQYLLGVLYYEKGLYHKSLEYVNLALDNYTGTGNTSRIMQCWNLIGTLLFACNDIREAESYFKKYETEALRSQDSTAMVKALVNRAIVTIALNDTTKALSLYRQSLGIARNVRDSAQLCQVYLNYSAMCWGIGELDSSEFYLHKAQPLVQDIRQAANWHLNYALLLFTRNRKKEAIQEARAAISDYSHGEFETSLQKCYNILNLAYKSLGDIDSAYMALTAYFDIEHQLNRNNVFIELFNTRNDFMLQQEKEKAMREKVRTRTIYLTVLASAIIGILIFIMLFHRNRYRLKEKENELKSQNAVLEVKKMQSYNMDILTKNIIARLEKLKEETSDERLQSHIKSVCDELHDTKTPQEWKDINMYIPDINSDFYKNLVKQFPSLTVNERRLCMLIHQNLSTKEISNITRQSPHSINIARGRLRNKLCLTGEKTSLQEFLSRFDSQ